MNLKRLKEVVHGFEEDLDGGLLACDVFDREGLSIYGINSNPQACALFGNITDMMKKSLAGSGFPDMEYYTIFAKDNKLVLVVELDEKYRFGCLVDRNKTTPGLIFSVALPRLIDGLKEAITS